MPHCENCGGFVTEKYVLVFSKNDRESVECCPECPDKLRRNGKPEEKLFKPKASTEA